MALINFEHKPLFLIRIFFSCFEPIQRRKNPNILHHRQVHSSLDLSTLGISAQVHSTLKISTLDYGIKDISTQTIHPQTFQLQNVQFRMAQQLLSDLEISIAIQNNLMRHQNTILDNLTLDSIWDKSITGNLMLDRMISLVVKSQRFQFLTN